MQKKKSSTTPDVWQHSVNLHLCVLHLGQEMFELLERKWHGEGVQLSVLQRYQINKIKRLKHFASSTGTEEVIQSPFHIHNFRKWMPWHCDVKWRVFKEELMDALQSYVPILERPSRIEDLFSSYFWVMSCLLLSEIPLSSRISLWEWRHNNAPGWDEQRMSALSLSLSLSLSLCLPIEKEMERDKQQKTMHRRKTETKSCILWDLSASAPLSVLAASKMTAMRHECACFMSPLSTSLKCFTEERMQRVRWSYSRAWLKIQNFLVPQNVIAGVHCLKHLSDNSCNMISTTTQFRCWYFWSGRRILCLCKN